MEVDTVEFVTRHLGHNLLQSFVGNEDTTRVDHEFAYVGARSVFNVDSSRFETTSRRIVVDHELFERHYAIEHACGSLTCYLYTVGIEVERVSLVVGKVGIDAKRNLCRTIGIEFRDACAIFENAEQMFLFVI